MLDTPVPSQDGSRKLNCLIEGECIVFSVTVGRDWNVGELKKEIKSERALGILKDVGPHTLEMWKVNIDLKTHDEDSISHLRLEEIGEGVEELTWMSILEYWPDQPPTTHLHIIVKIPATGE
ncbi:hypothetical protein L208DRAFT_469369 [Tricholoma matsutake]|nr:hypothetical protein L208DRAFT_469369 [Tricholoma matsutake 945]